MPCPYFKNKMCTSPLLPEPSSAVVVPGRCLSDNKYKTCQFYTESKESKEQGVLAVSTLSDEQLKELKPYPPIHYLENPLRSNCPYYRLLNYGGYYLAYCEILGRILTRHEALLCSRYWETCPISKLGYRVTSEETG